METANSVLRRVHPEEMAEIRSRDSKQEPFNIFTATIDFDSEKENEQTEDKNKCGMCSKKTGIFDYACQCGLVHCKAHRLPEKHNCSFDFKAHSKELLTRLNPKIMSKKITKI